jgi:hypothetical protein
MDNNNKFDYENKNKNEKIIEHFSGHDAGLYLSICCVIILIILLIISLFSQNGIQSFFTGAAIITLFQLLGSLFGGLFQQGGSNIKSRFNIGE